MIIHKSNGNTGKVTKVFEGRYISFKNEKAYFKGYGGYIDKIGPYDNTFRLSFPEQEELKVLIENLIELYNDREGYPSDNAME